MKHSKTTVNVGVKEDQKARINLIMGENPSKYNSVNDFVQIAVEKMLSETNLSEKKSDSNVTGTINKISFLLSEILEKQLEDKIKRTRKIQ